jgi:predicted nuclease of restriction endonuclease-like RecB superfamily
LLPRPFLHYRRDGNHARPAWLEPSHDAWLRTALEAFDACAGLTTTHANARVHSLSVEARRNGLAEPVAGGVWHVLRRWSTTVVEAPVPPRRLREEMFTRAATTPVHEVMETFCRRFDGDAARVKSWLYADLPGARVLRTKALPTVEGLRDAYNMSLAQGLVGRCTWVAVRVEENVRVVVRAAKLRGLLVSVDAEGPLIRASGPLALFRQTTKYAHALAMFIPALVSLPSWSLEGELHLGPTPAQLDLDATAPLPRQGKLPSRTDSALEAALVRGLRRSKSDWTILREPIIFRVGSELFFPDFVLARGADRVVVEVVGFWTPDYLERKLSQLATVTDVPLVVCVDETLACDPSRLPLADVVRFRRRLDPAELLAAAERAASSWHARRARDSVRY